MSTALVVEDSITDLEMITNCLQQGGITVLTARTGEEALAKVNSHKPDVIVLDVVLPGSNGYQICRALKNKAETSKIPVILCSTKGTEIDKFWGMKQGADAYLPKPVQQADILRAVKQALIA